jgi:hypothetical protein
MAFTAASFTRVGGDAYQQLFIYSSNDLLSGGGGVDITESGYFNDVINDLNVHDVILVAADLDGTASYCRCVVTSVTTNVTVSTNVTQS